VTPEEHAEARLAWLGISEVSELLELEAIAFDAGMRVEYANLVGCDATLVGFNRHAIATIKRSASNGRDRFSIAHELGHWEMHRGRSFQCRGDDIDQNIRRSGGIDRDLEKQADVYAAHLLMPTKLFVPAINTFRTLGFAQLNELSATFQTSLLATALRVVNVNQLPVIFACYRDNALAWCMPARDVPARWRPVKRLAEDSFAIDVLTARISHPLPGKHSGDVWFDNDGADRHEVTECCVPGRPGEVWVMLRLSAEMTEEVDTWSGSRVKTGDVRLAGLFD
jgi:Zn-dependent peptidase ImmA (M78 family)